MNNYNLNIADYNIGFYTSDQGVELIPSERFLRNLTTKTQSCLTVSVHSGSYSLPPEAERVFHAPFVEEVNGIQLRHKANFWSIWKSNTDLYIKTIFPLSSSEKNGVLKFALNTRHWELWIEGDDNVIDPLEYPLDGLILYYLTVLHGDIMIHASGVNNAGKGYLFSGVSGKGKTTLAELWNDLGAKVIHDDRLILRNAVNGYRMYNTPVYNNDEPKESVLNKIFIIEHGIENKLVKVKGATAISLVMANCIQHNWGSDIIEPLLGSVSKMCATIPVIRLSFKPDKSVTDRILEDE